MAFSVTYTFVPGQPAEGGQVNQDFTDVANYLNGLSIPTIPVSIANGGTGATSASAARTALGLGSAATQPTSAFDAAGAAAAAQAAAISLSCQKSANLSDVNSLSLSLANLGGVSTTQLNADFVRSLGSPGYQYILSGLLIQWGTATAPSSGGNRSSVAVSFPLSFPSSVVAIAVAPQRAADAGAMSIPSSSATSPTQSGFTIILDTLGATNFSQTVPVFWIALGF